MDLVNMSNRRTPVLKIFGNGSIVDTAGYKHQAEEAPSIKLQASRTTVQFNSLKIFWISFHEVASGQL